jgi:hypothetical protein
MSYLHTHTLSAILAVAGIAMLFIVPVHAFTADSLDIRVNATGDAVAVFRFTLQGFFERAIPLSMLEEEIKKGLTTGTEPPVLLSMDRSGATILLKKFAETRDVEQGTEYRTAFLDFQAAEAALQNSSMNSMISADFSPAKITITFPDGYTKTFENSTTLPPITHLVIDPFKPAVSPTPARTGTVTISASPASANVSIDGTYAGDLPGQFTGIPAGTHTFLFQKEGFLPVTKNVTVVAGRTTTVSVILPVSTPPAKAPSGLPFLPGFGMALACLALCSCALFRKIPR